MEAKFGTRSQMESSIWRKRRHSSANLWVNGCHRINRAGTFELISTSFHQRRERICAPSIYMRVCKSRAALCQERRRLFLVVCLVSYYWLEGPWLKTEGQAVNQALLPSPATLYMYTRASYIPPRARLLSQLSSQSPKVLFLWWVDNYSK